MNNEEILAEITSLLELIDQTRVNISQEHEKFQIALTNTLRLLDERSPMLDKMKGDVGNLKAYLIRTSSETRQAFLDPLKELRVRVERIRALVQS
ncbi:MAG: hypothetical protein ACFFE2_05640 [Candidatus Thorarchaeota archaeon]